MNILLYLFIFLWNYADYTIAQDVPLVRVNGDHAVFRDSDNQRLISSKRREMIANADAAMRWNHRRASTSSDIIFAPLNDPKIITKERLYQPSNRNVYEQLERSANQQPREILDPIFVTAPPARTTVAVRSALPEATTEVLVNGGKGEGFEPTLSPFKPSRQTTNLKLVTLSPVYTTPLPPFKYTRSAVNMGNNIQFRPPPPNIDQTPSSLVRFPAQPWQIPPRDPLHNQRNIFSHLFEVTPPSGFPPPNPFANLLNLPQSAMTNPLNLTVFPFIPIGTSNPPWTPPGAIQPQPTIPYANREIDSQMIHKSPLRVGFQKTRELPLPPQPFGNEEYGLQSKIEIPREEFSIDSKPQIASVDFKQPYNPYKPSAKTFVTEKKVRIPETVGKNEQIEKMNLFPKTEGLREFMRIYPNAMNSMTKPSPPMPPPPSPPTATQASFKPTYSNISRPPLMPTPIAPQPIIPKATMVGGGPSMMTSMGMMSTSGFNPNQKLDLCCRKQQVSSTCQSLCNFDSFNDKTLVSAFLTNQCPGPQLGKAYDCASSKADHTACCQAGGLQSFLGGRCMAFCRTHQATPANVLEYVSCLQVFDTIKNCYRQYQYSNKNIFGD